MSKWYAVGDLIVSDDLLSIVSTELVETKWVGNTRRHYEALGYKYTGRFDPLFVSPHDLVDHSRVFVAVHCPLCNEKRKAQWVTIVRYGHTKCFRCASSKNISGNKYGRLTPVSIYKNDRDGAFWYCLCDCGEIAIVSAAPLVSGDTRSCGCLMKESRHRKGTAQAACKDISGNRYGRLTVLEYSHSKKARAYWKCVCDCGNIKYAPTSRLKQGKTKSCGCLTKKRDWSDEQRQLYRKRDGYYAWRKSVIVRDKKSCVICKSTEKITAHHLYDYSTRPDLAIDTKNGICLCEKCHVDFHNFMGTSRTPCTPDDFNNWRHYRNTIESSSPLG